MTRGCAHTFAENLVEYGKRTRNLEFLGRHQYTDRTHFILELLQNAKDARHASEDGVNRESFNLFPDHVETRRNGQPFKELDLRGVCGIGEITKKDDVTCIGKLGIGFNSVYDHTQSPGTHLVNAENVTDNVLAREPARLRPEEKPVITLRLCGKPTTVRDTQRRFLELQALRRNAQQFDHADGLSVESIREANYNHADVVREAQ
jgi:hypothetical protein